MKPTPPDNTPQPTDFNAEEPENPEGLDLADYIDMDYLKSLSTWDFFCKDCIKLGYCKTDPPGQIKSSRSDYPLGRIDSYIPQKTSEEQLTEEKKSILQQAYDSFHQKDYETTIAILNNLLEEDTNCPEIQLTLAVSNYYLSNFEESYYILNDMLKIQSKFTSYLISGNAIAAFMDLCVQMASLEETITLTK